MIVKMKFISITGPKYDIDRVIDRYLSKYEMHLENTLAELRSVDGLVPYVEANPYKETLAKASELYGALHKPKDKIKKTMTVDIAIKKIDKIYKDISEYREKIQALANQKESYQNTYDKIAPFRELKYHIENIKDFKYINYHFGRLPKELWNKIEAFGYGEMITLFVKCNMDAEYVWGIYFTPTSQFDKIDAVFSSLHFEETYIPDELTGSPAEVCLALEGQMDALNTRIEELYMSIQDILLRNEQGISRARAALYTATENFDVRRKAACTHNDGVIFYIICGWMCAKDSNQFLKETEDDDDVVCIIEDDDDSSVRTPPTRLKNPFIFRPFELFVRMYGLPAYNEFDPTIFVALTYAFIFGAMFGDVGQGLCLMVGGVLLYRFKGIPLAAVIACAGLFSAIFGFMFGSIFGFEDIIEPIWIRPVSNMTTLPFIGKLNTVFVIAVGFGMMLILVTMIFHIINGIKSRDIENTWFDTNGLTGLVFYGTLVAATVCFMTGHSFPGGIILVLMFVIPMILMILKEPISKYIEKKKDFMPKGIGMFVTQATFEMFEVLLSYFSNTISFVRIGAFAVSHAAMMEVVLMLAGAEKGTPNFLVIVIGNLIVIGMEGLIVGIQVLRLEYYELFSRFYKGTGTEFKPFSNSIR